MMKETLKSLCCSNGWSYAVFWGFDQKNSLLLTLKDCYYEEQMGALIDSMLLQAHVLGGGVIGQTAFGKNHRWVDSFDRLEEDSDFFCQFSMGIKTIAIISVEPWGVLELGSPQKNLESKEFVDQVQLLFREMDGSLEIEAAGNYNSSNIYSSMEIDGVFDSESLLGADNSLLLPSLPFPSSVHNPIQTSSNKLEQLLFDCPSFFDCSAPHQDLSSYSDSSLLTSSWPHLSSVLEDNTSFLEPRDQESCNDSNLNYVRNLSSSITPTDSKAQTLSGLLTVEEFFAQSNLAKAMENESSQYTGLIPGSSLSGSSTPLPTNSLQSSVTCIMRSSDDVKCSMEGVEAIRKKPVLWNVNGGSKLSNSNSLFSKLGLDQILDGIATTSNASRFEGQSSLSTSKRRRTGNFSWSQNHDPSFDGKLISYKPEAMSTEVCCKDFKKEPRSCIDDTAKTSSSRREEEYVKPKKTKAKAGTKPRPKDRQMIQDRLAELRELIPNGEKMSIDRLLERTIRHLNFMQSLTRHAESLTQIAKPKSAEVRKNQMINGSDGGVTWAYEVDNDAMVCPLIVEDLSTPGQMLIEILCDEHGFLLEIVEIIRGFGLTILKGEMEVRATKKIWGQFMVEVEGMRFVTRHEIFSSLIRLLQMTGQSGGNESESYGNANDSYVPVLNNFQTPASFPHFGDALQCASL